MLMVERRHDGNSSWYRMVHTGSCPLSIQTASPLLYDVHAYGLFNRYHSVGYEYARLILVLRTVMSLKCLQPVSPFSSSRVLLSHCIGKLPFLMYSTGKTIAETEIKEFAAQRAGRLDSTTKGQVAIAAITLLNKSIRPALMAALWLEEPSRSKLTKRNYMRNIPWPVSDLLAWKQRRSIKGEVLYGKAGIKQVR